MFTQAEEGHVQDNILPALVLYMLDPFHNKMEMFLLATKG